MPNPVSEVIRFGVGSILTVSHVPGAARCWNVSDGKGELDLSAWRAETLRAEILHGLAHQHGIAARAVPELLHLTEAQVESGAHFVCATARVERRGNALHWIPLT